MRILFWRKRDEQREAEHDVEERVDALERRTQTAVTLARDAVLDQELRLAYEAMLGTDRRARDRGHRPERRRPR